VCSSVLVWLQVAEKCGAVLYEPYPTGWPEYTPKDLLADWMEQYAAAQDLAVWTSASLAPLPPYDTASRTWTLSVTRGDGATATVHPTHVVLATSTLGPPHMPSLPSAHLFPGPVLHSSAYRTPTPFAEKAVLIVGAGNTAADLATLLAPVACSVVLLQRSPTCMIFPGATRGYWAAQNPPGMLPEEADFRAACVPPRIRMRAARAWAEQKGEDADIGDDDDRARRDALRTAGFRTWTGAHGGGAAGEIDERFAGASRLLLHLLMLTACTQGT
jgi:cation diffusion facilitator CzcD-associated flavoprotein CzcO